MASLTFPQASWQEHSGVASSYTQNVGPYLINDSSHFLEVILSCDSDEAATVYFSITTSSTRNSTTFNAGTTLIKSSAVSSGAFFGIASVIVGNAGFNRIRIPLPPVTDGTNRYILARVDANLLLHTAMSMCIKRGSSRVRSRARSVSTNGKRGWGVR